VGERPVEGRVVTADEAGVAVDVGGTIHQATYAELGPGTVQVEFARTAAPAGTDGESA